MKPGRDVPLTERHLASIPSSALDPESILIARESLTHDEDDDDESQARIPENVREILTEFLPLQEASLLHAYFLEEQTQRRIADGLRRPKQSIQYRIGRAITRTQWALKLETWNRQAHEIARDLGPLMGAEAIDFVVVLWENRWNQSHTAEWYGIRPQAVRTLVLALHTLLLEHSGQAQVAPYARDLSRVRTKRAWCMGSGQVQGKRAIAFPKLRRA